jgi:hypothetical protein
MVVSPCYPDFTNAHQSGNFRDWNPGLRSIILNGCIALLYPLWLSLLNSANWDVFGDKDQSQLTITGAMIFALLISFSAGILSAIQQTFLGAVPMEQALQYTVHFVVGDTLGTGVVIFLFYKLLQLNIRTQNK